MAGEKNFNIKNGLSVGGVEVIDSNGDIVAAGVGTAVNEAIADKIGGIISATGGATATYNDSADTIVIDVPITDEDNMASNSATAIPSQQSVKAYVDAQVDTADALSELSGDSDDITEGSTNLFFTNARADARISNAIKDEDNMASDSATHVASQQSVKAYVDSQVASKDALSELSGDTDDITEGSSNLYFTNARADARISNAIKDEDNMASDSATHVPSQQSVKAFVTAQIATKDNTDEITEGSTNLYFTNARADARITNALLDEDDMSSNSATKVPSQQSVKAYVDSQVDTADHLSELGGTTDNLTEGSSNLFHTTERVQDVVGGQLVTNGSHTGVSFAYDDSGDGAIDATVSLSGFSTSNLSEGSNQYHTTERVQDVVGGQLVTNGSHTNITASYDDSGDGAIDLSISDADIRGKISVTDSGGDGSLAYNNSTGVITYTGITDAQVRGKVSVTDSGGDGSLAYNNSTGVITYTGPSASEVRAHISGGTGVSVSSGEISIGQAVSTSSDVTFNNMVVSGNLTVSGTTTTVNTATLSVADNQIILNSDYTGSSPTENGGIEIERGTQTNKTLVWNETDDKWTVGSETFVAGTFEGNLTGNVTGTVSSVANHDTDDISEGSSNLYFTNARVDSRLSGGTGVTYSSGTISIGQAVATSSDVEFNEITTNYANNSGGVARNIYQSTSAPTGSDGAVGDLWILYS